MELSKQLKAAITLSGAKGDYRLSARFAYKGVCWACNYAAVSFLYFSKSSM